MKPKRNLMNVAMLFVVLALLDLGVRAGSGGGGSGGQQCSHSGTGHVLCVNIPKELPNQLQEILGDDLEGDAPSSDVVINMQHVEAEW